MKFILLTLLLVCGVIGFTQGTHLRAGQISVTQNTEGLTCKITITVFTSSNSSVKFGGIAGEFDILSFGDGTTLPVPEQGSIHRFDLGPNIDMASFTIEHTYKNYGQYVVSYSEPNRNEGVINFSNSVNTSFYLESFISLSPGKVYSTPFFIMDPILRSSTGSDYQISLGAIDPNDNQLFYYLTPPKQSTYENVEDYHFPEDIAIDPISGLLTWDTKFRGQSVSGEFGFAVKVYQISNNIVVGYMVRDFQIITSDNPITEEPSLSGGMDTNGRLYVAANESEILRVKAVSGSISDLNLKIVSELDKYPENFSYSIKDSIGGSLYYKIATISISNTELIMRDTPYLIVARASANSFNKDITYVVATKDVIYSEPLILRAEENKPTNEVVLSPNPVKDFLLVMNNGSRILSIKIFHIDGRLLFDKNSCDELKLDMRTFSSGVYIILINKGGTTSAYRIVKE